MSDLTLFYAENVAAEITEEIALSERFKDAEGKPLLWKIRSVSENETSTIRKESTKKVKVKGVYQPETDSDIFTAKLVVAGVVYPNLKDAGLQNSYGVLGAESLVRKMLLAGEYTTLVDRIQTLSGYDRDINDLMDEVKN
ncbi:phage portal protein [Paenibacillus kribbensis]|uniref:phage tail assembly chaperone n=1 Tax=Paenibacillus kribbensis TaxID=172713 RepID=UPI002DB9DBF7|nr:phage portal protein [Paenibacillus kribbensis]MEC0233597.1 phage portal protein [Paenibacillus kribbensis]